MLVNRRSAAREITSVPRIGIGGSKTEAVTETRDREVSAVASDSLAKFERLHLDSNRIGDAGSQTLAGVIASGSLAALIRETIHTLSEGVDRWIVIGQSGECTVGESRM